MTDEHEVTAESIAAEFPGWEAWRGTDRRWHARIRGATHPAMAHGEDLLDLREEIIRYLGKTEECQPAYEAWAGRQVRHRPEDSTL